MYKKAITFMALVLFTSISFAQTSIFDKFEDYDEVSTVVVNSEMFRMMAKVGSETPEAKEYAEMINGLKELKVFSTEDEGIAKKMQKTFEDYLTNKSLTQLMRVKDKGSNARIYVKKGANEDIVKELLMFAKKGDKGTKNTVLMSLIGTIDLNQISKLASELNIPGGAHLKRGK